jgi:hypothetical protein
MVPAEILNARAATLPHLFRRVNRFVDGSSEAGGIAVGNKAIRS